MNKRFLGALMVVALLLGLAGIAVAQTGGGVGLVRPLVVSIEQAVPVELTLAVAQGDGTVVTMTAPITVAVGLQIRIDGDQVVAVAPVEAAEPPVVAVEAAPVMAVATDSEGYQVDDILWRVVGAEAPGSVFDDPDDMYREITTAATFVVVEFLVENVGSAPTDIRSNVEVFLRDDQERVFEMADGYFGDACFLVDMNPGISARCRMLFEVPPTATGFEVLLGETGVVSIME